RRLLCDEFVNAAARREVSGGVVPFDQYALPLARREQRLLPQRLVPSIDRALERALQVLEHRLDRGGFVARPIVGHLEQELRSPEAGERERVTGRRPAGERARSPTLPIVVQEEVERRVLEYDKARPEALGRGGPARAMNAGERQPGVWPHGEPLRSQSLEPLGEPRLGLDTNPHRHRVDAQPNDLSQFVGALRPNTHG